MRISTSFLQVSIENEQIINIFAQPYIEDYLKHAFTSRGYLFNPERHSPCELYQALLNNPDWEITVDGENCELPDPLLDPDAMPDNKAQ